MDITREWLVEKYCDQQMSCKQIADIVGVNKSSVERWMSNHGIQKRLPGWRPVKKSEHVWVDGVEHKTCSKCGNVLLLDCYVKDSKRPDGLVSECKACRNAKKKEARDNNRGYVYIKQPNKKQQWLIDNWEKMEKRGIYSRDSMHDNGQLIVTLDEKRKKARQSYYKQKTDSIDRIRQQWRKHKHNRRARNRLVANDLKLEEWQEALEYFDRQCAYCGNTHTKLTQEHVVPLSKGGGYIQCNIIPACLSCNSSKGNKDMNDWYKRQSFFNTKKLNRIRSWMYNAGQQDLFKTNING